MKKGVDEESTSVLYYDSRADEGGESGEKRWKPYIAQDVP